MSVLSGKAPLAGIASHIGTSTSPPVKDAINNWIAQDGVRGVFLAAKIRRRHGSKDR